MTDLPETDCERYDHSIKKKDAQMTENKNKKFSVVSLFSGCGGMDLGFKGGNLS